MILPKEIRQEANRFATEKANNNEELRLMLIEAFTSGAISAVEFYELNENTGLATDDIVVQGAEPCHVLRSVTKSGFVGPVSAMPTFEDFWKAYDKKVGKAKAEKLWNKLTFLDKQDCMEYVPKYVEAQDDKQYRKNPETFLRNRCWEDEIIYRDGGQNYGRNNNNLSANEQERMFLEQSARNLASPYNR